MSNFFQGFIINETKMRSSSISNKSHIFLLSMNQEQMKMNFFKTFNVKTAVFNSVFKLS